MNFGQRYIYDQLNKKAAGVLTPELLGPCRGKECPTCTHFDETIAGLTKSSETQKPSASDRSKAKQLKELKTKHKKVRV